MIKIGVLGWGSLIWDKEKNEMKGFEIKGDWFEDGPLLPIEFARISNDSRLTLVLFPSTKKKVQVLWACLKSNNLENAIQTLVKREETNNKNISFYERESGKFHCCYFTEIIYDIKQWTNEKKLDIVIWTDLKSNFYKVANSIFNEINIIKYLKSTSSKDVEAYIRKTPRQIKTPMREVIERELGWTPPTI